MVKDDEGRLNKILLKSKNPIFLTIDAKQVFAR